ncbi:hypothetical protein ACTXG6_38515 [Pseudonocardia sp. Cha107L01]|jgi:hypothetical protein|uniref:hypothetical protein n=1 Tax=Pseudonocardia sp. Cha107L01 TaxID=3457576 RepID=UPI00403E549B
MRNSRANSGFSAGAPAPMTQAPDGLADAVRDALAREQQSDDKPAPGRGAPRPGTGGRGDSAALGHRSGSRSGRSGPGRRSQQPNGCSALRRRGG